jgi:hypothetical protein
MPTRCPDSSSFFKMPSSIILPCTDFPSARTRANSAARARRAALGNRRRGFRPAGPVTAASWGAGGGVLRPGCGARNEPRRPWASNACGHAAGDG